jgi:ParB family chromosome partitioning protein
METRHGRAEKIEKLDARVSEIVKALQAKGLRSPYLKAFVVARVNPLMFLKAMPPFDEALDDILKRAARFDAGKVRPEDVSTAAGPASEPEG